MLSFAQEVITTNVDFHANEFILENPTFIKRHFYKKTHTKHKNINNDTESMALHGFPMNMAYVMEK